MLNKQDEAHQKSNPDTQTGKDIAQYVKDLSSKLRSIEKEIVKNNDQVTNKTKQFAEDIIKEIHIEVKDQNQIIQELLHKMVESNLNTEQTKIQRVKQFQVKIDKEQSSFKINQIQEMKNDLKQLSLKIQSQQKQDLISNQIEIKLPEQNVVIPARAISQDKITSIESSFLMGHFTGNLLFDNDKKVKIDQDILVFDKMLEFLKNDQSQLTNGVTEGKELKESETDKGYRQVRAGMQKFFNISYSKQQFEVIQLLNSEPVMNPDESQEALVSWKKFQPLTLDEITKHSNLKVEFDNDAIEYKKLVDDDGEYISIGQFKKGSEDEHGIAREVQSDNDIYEGQFFKGEKNGYGREFYEDGSYYIGMWKNHQWNGKGKYVEDNNKIKEGKWKDGKIVES